MKTVSVLIPTYNAEKYIERLLIKIFNQCLPEDYCIEVIIVDSTSNDNTVTIINEKFPLVKVLVIDNYKFDHGGTRNLLSDISTGEYLLFMTQDAIPYDDHLIINLLNSFKYPDVHVSYARQIANLDASPLEKFAREFNYPNLSITKSLESIPHMGIKTFFNSNVCSMYKKSSFIQYNKFPEEIILNEDMIFSSKVILNGFKVHYCAEAKVFHSHNYTFKQQFKRYFDIGMAFEQTSFLLKYASNEKEGLRMIKNQIVFLMNQNKYMYIPKAFIDNGFKFLGYYIGKKHNKIPRRIKRKFSAYMK